MVDSTRCLISTGVAHNYYHRSRLKGGTADALKSTGHIFKHLLTPWNMSIVETFFSSIFGNLDNFCGPL